MTGYDPARVRTLAADGLSVFVCPNGPRTVYAFGGEAEARAIFASLTVPCSLVLLSGLDWDRDLSPWPAPRAFKSGCDFEGGADALAEKLARSVVPAAEEITGPQTERIIAGYSLAGLFSLYCLFRSELFSGAVSASGSLWFDGFADYMSSHELRPQAHRAYLSVGDREKHARSPRLACVEERTVYAAELLRSRGLAVTLEFNRGGHFSDSEQRLIRGILDITSDKDLI